MREGATDEGHDMSGGRSTGQANMAAACPSAQRQHLADHQTSCDARTKTSHNTPLLPSAVAAPPPLLLLPRCCSSHLRHVNDGPQRGVQARCRLARHPPQLRLHLCIRVAGE